MEKQHKLMRPFLSTAINIVFFLSIIAGFSCSRNEDAWNQLVIENQLEDTLTLQATKKYISDIPGPPHIIYPKSVYCLAQALHNSDMEMIRENWGNPGDTIEIYINGELVIKWGGPLLDRGNTFNHFFNEQSWHIRKGGKKDKYTIATFSLSETDLEISKVNRVLPSFGLLFYCRPGLGFSSPCPLVSPSPCPKSYQLPKPNSGGWFL